MQKADKNRYGEVSASFSAAPSSSPWSDGSPDEQQAMLEADLLAKAAEVAEDIADAGVQDTLQQAQNQFINYINITKRGLTIEEVKALFKAC